MNALQQIQLFRDAANVKRYHTKRTIREQTVGAHSFDMLTLLLNVCPDCRKEVILACVYHDLPELFTGDIPAPVKRADPGLALRLDEMERLLSGPLYKDFNLTEMEIAVLKWVDRMELVLWCIEDFLLGNTYVADTIRRGMGWIVQAGIPSEGGCGYVTTQVLDVMFDLDLTPATGAELEAAR